MHYLLVEAARPHLDDLPPYCGLARRDISHVLDGQSPLYNLWLEELPRIGDSEWDMGYARKMDAVRFLSVIRRHGLAFDCIAVCACATEPEASEACTMSGFIGYDVANRGGVSILSPEYLYGNESIVDNESVYDSIQALFKKTCRILANSNGLITAFNDALLLKQVVDVMVEQDGDNRYCGDMTVFAIAVID